MGSLLNRRIRGLEEFGQFGSVPNVTLLRLNFPPKRSI